MKYKVVVRQHNSRITKEPGRLFEGTGEILLSSGDMAITAYVDI